MEVRAAAKEATEVKEAAKEVMEVKGVAKEAMEAKEAVIASLFRIDDNPCVLIWVYDLTASYGKTGGEEYNSPYHSQQGSGGYGGPQSMCLSQSSNRPGES
jgi:hypothetical protein